MNKKVEHHKKEHHEKSHHEAVSHKPSKFSLFKHKIASIFKEIVEAPPEEIKPMQELEVKEEVKPVPEEELDEDELEEKELEKHRDVLHEEILENLNSAVSRWKETGDVGIHFEAPVPLREKVKFLLSGIKSSALSSKLKNKMDEVVEKVSLRLKKAESSGQKVNSELVVKDEWKKVLQKMESVSGPSEREEIEKIYKELVGE